MMSLLNAMMSHYVTFKLTLKLHDVTLKHQMLLLNSLLISVMSLINWQCVKFTAEYPDEKTSRKLTLVAKVIQTLANFTRLGYQSSPDTCTRLRCAMFIKW